MTAAFLVVQPYGRRPREATILSEHQTLADAYRELDRLAALAGRYGLQGAFEVRVVEGASFAPVARPRLQVQ